MEGVMSFLPGVSKIKKQIENSQIDENDAESKLLYCL